MAPLQCCELTPFPPSTLRRDTNLDPPSKRQRTSGGETAAAVEGAPDAAAAGAEAEPANPLPADWLNGLPRDELLKEFAQNGALLEYASEEHRADPEIVLAAVQNDLAAIAHISSLLLGAPGFLDSEVVKAALDQCGDSASRATIRALLKRCVDQAVELEKKLDGSFIHVSDGRRYRMYALPGGKEH